MYLLQSRFSISGQYLAWFQSYLSGRTQVFTTSIPVSQRPFLLPQVSLKFQCSFRFSSLHTQQTFQIPFLLITYRITCLQTTLRCMTTARYPMFRYWSIINFTACINDLQQSFASHRLKLNRTKTEFIWFGTHTTLSKIPAAYRSLPVGSSAVQSCETIGGHTPRT